MSPKTVHLSAFCGVLWLIASSIASAHARRTPTDPTGEWLVSKQYARIKIADCDGRLSGIVAWEAQPGGIDRKNPDPNLRSRPTLGMPILLGMAQTRPNQWDGQIYNSEDGHTYSASISLVDQRTLRVQGCFLGFLCGGENWTRFEPQDAQAAAPNTAKPSSTRKTTGNPQPPAPSDDVCSRALGSSTTGLSHERRLK